MKHLIQGHPVRKLGERQLCFLGLFGSLLVTFPINSTSGSYPEQCLTACGLSPFVCKRWTWFGEAGAVPLLTASVNSKPEELPFPSPRESFLSDLTTKLSVISSASDSFKRPHNNLLLFLQQSSDIVFWNYLLALQIRMEAHREQGDLL